MEKTINVIREAHTEGVFSSYAIGGGIAALFYIEPVATFDLDVFVIMAESAGQQVSLSPIYSWFEKRGYQPLKEQIVVEGIAVQFIPVYNELVREAVLKAVDKKYGNTTARVLGPEYLVAIMLQTFRPKDKDRIIKFLEQTTLSDTILTTILQKFELLQVYTDFRKLYDGR